MINTAYLLVTHGSRDPRPHKALIELASLIRQLMNAQSKTSCLLDIASLEFTELSLGDKIANFAQNAHDQGYQQLAIIPLFLSAGVHLTEDIPEAIIKAQHNINVNIDIILTSHLGSYDELILILKDKFESFKSEGRILLAHGSKKTEGNLIIENYAKTLNVLNAYWSIKPSLEEQVNKLYSQNITNIMIVPYFLFVGGISDRIGEQVKQLQQKHPELKIFLDQPLGATPALAQLIVKYLKFN